MIMQRLLMLSRDAAFTAGSQPNRISNWSFRPKRAKKRSECMELSYEDANQALNAAFDKAGELGVRLSVAVVDAVGNPVALGRMTGARVGTTSFACQGKAMVAAIWGVPSAEVAARVGSAGPIAEHAQALYGHRLLFLGGGLPLKVDGAVVGAIAASGGTGEEDLAVATAGAEAFGGRHEVRAG
jgi:uncharacterized protein GlcG (DUF336 family)